MNELRKLDKVAYVRFASVYKEFRGHRRIRRSHPRDAGGPACCPASCARTERIRLLSSRRRSALAGSAPEADGPLQAASCCRAMPGVRGSKRRPYAPHVLGRANPAFSATRSGPAGFRAAGRAPARRVSDKDSPSACSPRAGGTAGSGGARWYGLPAPAIAPTRAPPVAHTPHPAPCGRRDADDCGCSSQGDRAESRAGAALVDQHFTGDLAGDARAAVARHHVQREIDARRDARAADQRAVLDEDAVVEDPRAGIQRRQLRQAAVVGGAFAPVRETGGGGEQRAGATVISVKPSVGWRAASQSMMARACASSSRVGVPTTPETMTSALAGSLAGSGGARQVQPARPHSSSASGPQKCSAGVPGHSLSATERLRRTGQVSSTRPRVSTKCTGSWRARISGTTC